MKNLYTKGIKAGEPCNGNDGCPLCNRKSSSSDSWEEINANFWATFSQNKDDEKVEGWLAMKNGILDNKGKPCVKIATPQDVLKYIKGIFLSQEVRIKKVIEEEIRKAMLKVANTPVTISLQKEGETRDAWTVLVKLRDDLLTYLK